MPTTTVYAAAAVGALALVGGLTKEQQLPVIQLQPRFNHIFPRRRHLKALAVDAVCDGGSCVYAAAAQEINSRVVIDRNEGTFNLLMVSPPLWSPFLVKDITVCPKPSLSIPA